MSLRKPIIAAICAVLLFAFYLHDVRRSERAILTDLQDERVLFQNPEQVESVTFENSAGSVTVTKSDDTWWITSPRALPADQTIISTWLENLRGAKRHTVFKTDSLESYGLESPHAAVELTFRSDGRTETKRLEFGLQPHEFGRVFARLAGGDSVFSVSEWFYLQSLKDLDQLRDKAVITAPLSTVTSLGVQTPRGDFALRRAAATDTQWTLDHDRGSLPADGVIVDRILYNLTSVGFARVFDDPTSSTAEMGFDDPRFSITADGAAMLDVGAAIPGEERFLARNGAGTIGSVPGIAIADFFRPALEWGTKRFVWLPRESVTQLEIWSSGSGVMLLETRGGWMFADRPGVPVRMDVLEDYFTELGSMTATQLVKPRLEKADWRQYGLLDESYQVSVTDGDGRAQGFILGRTDSAEGQTHVLRRQDQSLWKMDFSNKIGLMKLRRDFEERRLLPGLPLRADVIEIESKGQGAVYRKSGSAWRATLPTGGEALMKPGQVEAFLAAFEALEPVAALPNAPLEPAVLVYRFSSNTEAEPFATVALMKHDREAGIATLQVGSDVVEVTSAQFTAMDNATAALLFQTLEGAQP